MLQKSAGTHVIEISVGTSSGAVTPEDEHRPYPNSRHQEANIDPALSGVSSPSGNSEGEAARDRAEEVWVENIRVIEALRKLIADRLERHDYEEDMDTDMDEAGSSKSHEGKEEEQSLYPVLRAAIDASE